MNFWETEEAVSYFKERRLKKRLTQADLVDSALSRPTVGNIESMKRHVGRAKVSLYCERLGFALEELPKILEERETQNKEQYDMLSIELRGIETIIDCIGAEEGQRRLKALKNIPATSPHRAMYHFLLGKCYLYKKNWTKTEKNLSEALRIAENFPELAETNVQSVCLYELSRAYVHQNDLKSALAIIDKGLSQFSPNSERQDIEFYLLFNKVFCYEKLERDGEADQILQKLWKREGEINSELRLNLAELQANLYNKQKMFTESIEVLNNAIDLARKENNYDRLYELWITSGSTYKQMGQLSSAKTCLKTASSIENKVKTRILTGYNYTQLGLLYLQENNYSQAESALERAVELCKIEAHTYRHVEALIALGECYSVQKKKTEAIYTLEKALKHAKKHFLRDTLKNILLKLALLWKDNIDKHQMYKDMHYQICIDLQREEGNSIAPYISR